MSGYPPPDLDSRPNMASHWSEIEDNILKQAVARHGVGRWDEVAKLVWTKKSAEECRARWAEIVPLLHDGLARREHDLGQQQRKRSMTTSASIPEALQGESTAYLRRSPSSPIRGRKDQGPEGEPVRNIQSVIEDKSTTQRHTEPPSPSPRAPSTMKDPPSSIAEVMTARGRRNTEPGVRPSHTTPGCRRGEGQRREWIAPHPLMPGRSRKQSASQRAGASGNKGNN